MTQYTPWASRLSTRLAIIAIVLFSVSAAIGGANLWAFHQLEHDTALEMLGCGRGGGDHCRELGRAHLDRLHHLQYAFMALSVLACGLVTWLTVEVQTRVRALTVLSERLERGEPTGPVSGRDDLAAIGRSIGSTVRRLEQQRATEREVLGDRIDTLLSLNRALAEGAGGALPTSFQSSGRFAVASPSLNEPPALGRVLLVDDEPEVLRGFARVLKERGHHVATASHAGEAITKLSEGRFDVVVSDISMPGMDGIQLLKEVRRRDLTVPVILATGRPAVKSAAEAVECGAFQYLIKPILNENLCQVVEHGVRVSRMGRVKDEAAELLGHNAALGADRAGLEVTFDRTLQTLWMAFQPIIDVKARTVYAFESLLRSDVAALPTPGTVLDAAERLGRLDALGRVVRAKSAAEFAAAPPSPRLSASVEYSTPSLGTLCRGSSRCATRTGAESYTRNGSSGRRWLADGIRSRRSLATARLINLSKRCNDRQPLRDADHIRSRRHERQSGALYKCGHFTQLLRRGGATRADGVVFERFGDEQHRFSVGCQLMENGAD